MSTSDQDIELLRDKLAKIERLIESVSLNKARVERQLSTNTRALARLSEKADVLRKRIEYAELQTTKGTNE